MAGGVWAAQNKLRPGAYINFEAAKVEEALTGSRGIATFAMELDWGNENELIEVTMNDLMTGNSLSKIGVMGGDTGALLPQLALQNAQLLKIYRLNKKGKKATITINDNLTVTAKCPGVFGNKISILITKSTDNKYNVQTYANGYLADVQKVTKATELVANDFVTFEYMQGTVETANTENLSEVTTTLLTGGENGSSVTDYTEYFKILQASIWNTMAVPTSDKKINSVIVDFIIKMRDNEGKYVQAVVANSTDADYEGIINNVNGVVLNDGTNISATDFTVWVAGATAGAEMIESNTGKIVENATSIIDMLDNEQIIDGLQKGKFILSLTQDGEIKVEKDINSLHTFEDKNYTFSKNRVIRELDEIGSSIQRIWEKSYLGKVTNDDNGRTMFKSSIIDYLTELSNKGAIDKFSANDVIVEKGIDIDSVIATIAIKPLDSMEILYITVTVS